MTTRRSQTRWVSALDGTLLRGFHAGELVTDVAADDPLYLQRLVDFESLTDDERTTIEVALANRIVTVKVQGG